MKARGVYLISILIILFESGCKKETVNIISGNYLISGSYNFYRGGMDTTINVPSFLVQLSKEKDAGLEMGSCSIWPVTQLALREIQGSSSKWEGFWESNGSMILSFKISSPSSVQLQISAHDQLGGADSEDYSLSGFKVY